MRWRGGKGLCLHHSVNVFVHSGLVIGGSAGTTTAGGKGTLRLGSCQDVNDGLEWFKFSRSNQVKLLQGEGKRDFKFGSLTTHIQGSIEKSWKVTNSL